MKALNMAAQSFYMASIEYIEFVSSIFSMDYQTIEGYLSNKIKKSINNRGLLV